MAKPVNGHIEVQSYTVTVGHTKVIIDREGTRWAVYEESHDHPLNRIWIPDHEAAHRIAAEYAHRLDVVAQKKAAAEHEADEVRRWFYSQVYRDEELDNA